MSKPSIKLLSMAVTASLFITAGAFASEKKASNGATGPNAHWSYSGSEGPSNWGSLSTAYELCSSGHQQSPINIVHAQQAGLVKIDTDYRAQPLHVLNNGHTIQVNYAPGSTMTVAHTKYDLLQFHFHSPSENQANGKAYPMEIHFVHKDQNGHLGVLGVFVETGDKNHALQEIWNQMPKSGGEDFKSDDIIINGSDLLPNNQDYYRFVGSLTTPPCSEGVQWHVMRDPIQASSEQVEAFLSVIGKNARPVQFLGHRLLINSAQSAGAAAAH